MHPDSLGPATAPLLAALGSGAPGSQPSPAGDPLFEEWQVYEKLLIHDYMDHRAFFGRLRQEIAERWTRPVTILDLGCGDLTPMLPLLDNLPVRHYVGVDESAVALDIARTRLRQRGLDEQAPVSESPANPAEPCPPPPGPVRTARLVQGDLLASLANLPGSFDVIVTSFALHHLPDPADKQRTFAACRRLLNAGGFLALIDVFCDQDEPREQYLGRWISKAGNHYAALHPTEKQLLFDHVRARDYPLSLEQCRALGSAAGLERFEVLVEDDARLNRLVTLAVGAGAGDGE